MTAIQTHDPSTAGPGLPELPPLPLGALAVGLANLLQDAAQLPQPRYIALFDPEQISMQFAPIQPSTQGHHPLGPPVRRRRHHRNPPGPRRTRDVVHREVQLLRRHRQGIRPHPRRPGQQLADQENPDV